MYHYEVIEEALEGIPPVEFFWNNSIKKNQNILDKVLNAYRKYSPKLNEVPPKSKNEIRPVFLNDYYSAGDNTPRNGREYSFVKRSLFYSDSVAVMDRLGMWSDLVDANGADFGQINLGDQRCPNGIADILQVIRYRDYEKLGLLQYYKFDQPYSYGDFVKQGQEEYYKMIGGDRDRSDPLLDQKYWLSLAELFKSLSLLSESGGRLDLYLPDWTRPKFSLDWLFAEIKKSQSSGSNDLSNMSQYRDAKNIQNILQVPAPGFSDFEDLDPEQLARIREQNLFSQFRDDLSGIAEQFSNDYSSDDLQDNRVRERLSQEFGKAKESFIKGFDKREFDWAGSISRGAITGGFTAGGYAALSEMGGRSLESLLVPGVVSLAAGVLSGPVYNFAKWFFSEKPAIETTKIHYRMFIAE